MLPTKNGRVHRFLESCKICPPLNEKSHLGMGSPACGCSWMWFAGSKSKFGSSLFLSGFVVYENVELFAETMLCIIRDECLPTWSTVWEFKASPSMLRNLWKVRTDLVNFSKAGSTISWILDKENFMLALRKLMSQSYWEPSVFLSKISNIRLKPISTCKAQAHLGTTK